MRNAARMNQRRSQRHNDNISEKISAAMNRTSVSRSSDFPVPDTFVAITLNEFLSPRTIALNMSILSVFCHKTV